MRYLTAHWRGDLTIWTSFLLNGVAVYVLIAALTARFGNLVEPHAAFYVYLSWSIWATVGMVRCALRVLRDADATMIQRAAAAEALLVSAVIVWYGARATITMLA